jgi:hypothetical protein
MNRGLTPMPVAFHKDKGEAGKQCCERTVFGLPGQRRMAPYNAIAANDPALRIYRRKSYALVLSEIRLSQLPQRAFSLDRERRERWAPGA